MGADSSSLPKLQGGDMQSSFLRAQVRAIFVILAACFATAVTPAQNPTHVVSGTIEKVDSGAKTIAVKTADGTVETVKFTEKTTVSGLKDGAKGADLVGKEGGHVIVHATGEGASKTAHSVEWLRVKTVHTPHGKDRAASKATKTASHKTPNASNAPL